MTIKLDELMPHKQLFNPNGDIDVKSDIQKRKKEKLKQVK